MKSISLEEFKGFRPCWLETAEGARRLEEIGSRKKRWTAMDILDLPEDEVSAEDKIWAVTKAGLIEEQKLHEFACRCAEEALKLVEDPDPRSVAAIEAKRKWLKGEISDEELDAASAAASAAARAAASAAASAAARAAAWDVAWAAASAAASAAARDTAWDAAWDAARDAAWAAARAAARAAASAAAWAAVWDAARDAARAAAWAARDAARAAARDATRKKQVAILRELIID
ncbi:hypothetical protein I5Q82_15745 [Acutalibacter muris]|uniref:Imm-5-like domain-containing protein n=1 Tax=Acutalibacter muris TaxID=1796620 RepID=A0AA92L5P3_9FIRM|nr:hypothetical protein [Acutalibacter muris]QQR29475.1 hypothetical protein I5Q82_15745 [Acutalibacter muris]